MALSYWKQQRSRWLLMIMAAIALTFILILTNLSLGSVAIPMSEILSVLTGQEASKAAWENIILNYRLPKTITACLVGAGLSVSGLQMQTLFQNPLAGPFVLGISSGASLGVAVLLMMGDLLGSLLPDLNLGGPGALVLAAIAGSLLILIVVMVIALRLRNNVGLLIVGLMFGAITSSLVAMLQYTSQAENIQSYVFWTFGSLGGTTWNDLTWLVPIVLVGLVITFLLAKPMDGLLLGEEAALGMGVNVKGIRLAMITTTGILAGSITAFCGPIAFIGIAIPHLTRLLFPTPIHRLLVPLTVIVGAGVMLICDTVAQLPGSQHSFPINAVTSLIGAPIIIWLVLFRSRNLNPNYS